MPFHSFEVRSEILSHHFVVWYAAELVYPGVKFDQVCASG